MQCTFEINETFILKLTKSIFIYKIIYKLFPQDFSIQERTENSMISTHGVHHIFGNHIHALPDDESCFKTSCCLGMSGVE